MASKIKIPRVSFLIDQPEIKVPTMQKFLWQRFLALVVGSWSYAISKAWSYYNPRENTIYLCVYTTKKVKKSNQRDRLSYIIDELNHEYMHSLLLQFVSYKANDKWNNADRARTTFNVSSWRED